jgi:hypothetical protein
LQPPDFARNRLAAELKSVQDAATRANKRHDVLRRKIEHALARAKARELLSRFWDSWCSQVDVERLRL